MIPGPRSALFLLPIALLAGCAPELATGGPDPAAGGSDWREMAARLPENLGPFRRGTSLPLAGGASGLEIPYATGGRVIAGYVRILADAGRQTDQEAALSRHIRDIASDGAAHRMLGEESRFAVPPGQGAFFRCAEMSGRYGRQPVDSLLCAATQGGHLVQLRLTMARREGRLEQAREFAAAVAAALR